MKKKIIFINIFLLLLCSNLLLAQGNLLITPIRVTLDSKKMSEDLTVNNIGNDTATYVVSFIHYRMNVDGSFTVLEKGDSSIIYADDYLRIFPRKVTLGPRESQVIKLQLRKSATMKEGELRSHLYFRAEKKIEPLGLADQKKDSSKMAIRITPIFGISIPIIVRAGNPELKLSLSNALFSAINDSISQLKFTINRSGLTSAYGNIKVVYQPNTGKAIEVGVMNGVGVYTELEKRDISMQLKLKKGKMFQNGKLIISYAVLNPLTIVQEIKTEYILN